MRVLTVRQPWAWAIIHGGKTVENRVRNIAGAYRGPVAIQAAIKADESREARAAWEKFHDAGAQLVIGAIIGVVDLVDVHLDTDHETGDDMPPSACRCRTEWAEGGAYHLVFENPRALQMPVPWTGALGLRKSDLEIIGDWLAECEPSCGRCAPPYGCPPGAHEFGLSKLVAVTS